MPWGALFTMGTLDLIYHFLKWKQTVIGFGIQCNKQSHCNGYQIYHIQVIKPIKIY